MLLNIIIFIVVLGVIVLVHELGHFLAAKRMGMMVEEFGIGFPPRLFSIKKNDTYYSINAIPLGGFVKIKGESYEKEKNEAKNPKLFYNRPIGARLVVVLAGIFMNLLFGWLILAIGFSFGFPSMTRDLSKISGAQVIKQEVVVAQVNEGTPAAEAEITPGMVLLSAKDGQEIIFKTVEDVKEFTNRHQGEKVFIQVRNLNNQVETKEVTLTSKSEMPLGVIIIPDNIVKFPLHIAGWQGLVETGNIIRLTGTALRDLLKDLFIHAKISEQISGPVGIYQATAQAAEVGFTAVVLLACIISINLALLNLVPFPALDGGKMAFILIEAIFRKRVIAVHVEQAIETIGFFLLIIFILAVTYKDIIRIG